MTSSEVLYSMLVTLATETSKQLEEELEEQLAQA